VDNSNNQGFVTRLVGRACATSRKNATLRWLKPGDRVDDDEKIVTTSGSILEISFITETGTETAVYM
jgi:hypothetical protein